MVKKQTKVSRSILGRERGRKRGRQFLFIYSKMKEICTDLTFLRFWSCCLVSLSQINTESSRARLQYFLWRKICFTAMERKASQKWLEKVLCLKHMHFYSAARL